MKHLWGWFTNNLSLITKKQFALWERHNIHPQVYAKGDKFSFTNPLKSLFERLFRTFQDQ